MQAIGELRVVNSQFDFYINFTIIEGVRMEEKELVNWKAIEAMLNNLDDKFQLRLSIDAECYWMNLPKDFNEDINRKIFNSHIQHAIVRFLEKKENRAALMELILRMDNAGELVKSDNQQKKLEDEL